MSAASLALIGTLSRAVFERERPTAAPRRCMRRWPGPLLDLPDPPCFSALLASAVWNPTVEGNMAIEVLVLKEVAAGERRVAATPETVKKLIAAGASIKVESGAGLGAGFLDQAYLDAGAQLATGETPAQADLVLCVQSPDAGRDRPAETGRHTGRDAAAAGRCLACRRSGSARHCRLSLRNCRAPPAPVDGRAQLAAGMPATGRADRRAAGAALLSLLTLLRALSGVQGADRRRRGGRLQAIATTKRLGAQVEGFDVRPETREQSESLAASSGPGVSAAARAVMRASSPTRSVPSSSAAWPNT